MLNGARGKADLAALDAAAIGELELDPGALDRIAILDRHLGEALREVANLRAALARGVELAGELVHGGRWQHGSALLFEEGVQRAVLGVEHFGADIDMQ